MATPIHRLRKNPNNDDMQRLAIRILRFHNQKGGSFLIARPLQRFRSYHNNDIDDQFFEFVGFINATICALIGPAVTPS